MITYVNAISSGCQPCLENAVLTLSQAEENAAAVQKAIAHYDQEMSRKMQLPIETTQELLILHKVSKKEAITIFKQNSFEDINEVSLKQLEVIVPSRLSGSRFLEGNMLWGKEIGPGGRQLLLDLK